MRQESSVTVHLPDGRPVKLGVITPASRPQALQFGRYLLRAGEPPPPSIDYATKGMEAIRQVYGNDKEGDCVIADRMHKIGVWTGNDLGTPVLGTEAEALSQYHKICGPGDRGCVVTEVLDYCCSHGIVVGGKTHKLDGYVALDNRNKQQVQVADVIFGGCTIAFHVPREWIQNARDGAVWDTPRLYQFVGDHDVHLVDYNAQGVRVATWGLLVTMTWRALADTRIVTEMYSELGQDWYNDDRLSPAGIDAATLLADLQTIKGGDLPPWNPSPPSPPPGKKYRLTVESDSPISVAP